MNALWGFILQYKTQFAIGAAILGIVLSIWLWGNSRYESGRTDERTDWLTKIATEPVKRDTVKETKWLPQPKQHMEGRGEVLQNGDGGLSWMDKDNVLHDTADSCADLKRIRGVTLPDSLGGRHEISYNPMLRKFTENYIPPFKEVLEQTIRERQTIPLEIESSFWLTLTPSYMTGSVGVGGLIGYKSIGVGYLKIADADIYQVGIHLAF